MLASQETPSTVHMMESRAWDGMSTESLGWVSTESLGWVSTEHLGWGEYGVPRMG